MLASFVVICCRAGVINPYTYEGEHRRYFINTGDMITGIGLDGSVATAMIGAFGMLYFFTGISGRLRCSVLRPCCWRAAILWI
ncbi:hypothetical protein ACQ86N_32925 [Puia sp. P3]|uniref:hypothetical protein n=1 Tax=Puia sp. P3 TaxID=3423952 RepID=UPI003D6729EE